MHLVRPSHVWLLAIAVGSACARPPLANPNVSPERGVVMGRLRIFAQDHEEVTKSCTVGLTDESGREIRVRPDESGWVFASAPKGKASISSIDCGARSTLMGLDFDVPGDSRTTYFGHVRIDLHPDTERTLSAANAAAIDEGMKAAPPTVLGAAVATGVGLAAMFLLSDTVAAGLPTTEVEDMTYEAAAAYKARYRRLPKVLVVSLAGSTFSSDPSISPVVQKKNDVIFTEASLGGVRLTWLAVANQEQRKAALRVQRFVRKDAPCPSMKLLLDGHERIIPAVSKTERASAAHKQTVQGEIDLPAIQDAARAKHVVVDVCGTTRAFSALARGATVNFANAYQQLAAVPVAAPEAAPVAAPPVAPATVAAPAAAEAAPLAAGVAEAAPVSPDGPVAPPAPEARAVR